MDLTNLTAEQIDLKKVELEKELQKAQQDLSTIEIADLELGKQVLELQSKRKDLQIQISKAKQVVKTLVLDIKILTSAFWRARG